MSYHRSTLRSQTQSTLQSTLTTRLKFLLCGESGVGKTAWLKRVEWELVEKKGKEEDGEIQQSSDQSTSPFEIRQEPTIGVDFLSLPITLRPSFSTSPSPPSRIHSNIFDLSGSPEYTKVRYEFYTDFNGLLLCFDLTNKASWEKLDVWWNEIVGVRSNADPSNPSNKDTLPHVLILGLKCDLELRKPIVPERDIKQWCRSKGATYFECSSKTGSGVMKAYEYLVEYAQGGETKAAQQQQQPASSSSQQQSSQQQRPPSASPSSSPSSSAASSTSSSSSTSNTSNINGGPTNIADLSFADLRRECTKRGISYDDSLSHSELLTKLREFLSRSRQVQAESHHQEQQQAEKQRDSIIEDVQKWSTGKDIRQMLNDIHQVTQGDSNYLAPLSSYAPVYTSYKKALVKIHPDKVSPKEKDNHLRATEMFKIVNSAFETFKKMNEKRMSNETNGSVSTTPPTTVPTAASGTSSTSGPRTARTGRRG